MGRNQETSNEEIVEAARRCFLASGPHVATAEIAKALGISQATLFSRFGSKRNLMIAALAPPLVPPWLSLLQDGPKPEDIKGQLAEISLILIKYLRKISPQIAILRSAGVEAEEVFAERDVPPPKLALKEIKAWLDRAKKQRLIHTRNTETFALALIGALQFGPFTENVCGFKIQEQPDEEYVQDLITALWAGINPYNDSN